jgi:hypothetical protein
MIGKLKYTFFIFLGFCSTIGYSQGKMLLSNNLRQQKTNFEFHNNLIIIPLEVNGISLNFILDTGASKTVIFTLNEADSLVLNNTKTVELRGLGSGEPIQAIVSENNRMELGNIMGMNQTIFMVLGRHFDFSSKVGKTIHGIIGYELLKDFVVSIDFNTKKLVFMNPEFFTPPKNEKYSSFNLDFHNKKPYLDGFLNVNDSIKHPVKMLIDMGNSDALWVFEEEKKGILCPKQYFIDHLGEGLSGAIEGKRTKVHSFRFGEYEFKKPTIAFLDSIATSYARTYEERNGSIGTQILNRFKIIFDYGKEIIYLKKNRSFHKEFRYNRSGIEITYFGKTIVKKEKVNSSNPYSTLDSDNGHILKFDIDYTFDFKPAFGIYKVRKDSPADLAGLRVNDIIYKINGKFAYEYKIEEINSIFYGDVGKYVTIYVDRDGLILFYEFQLKDLL